MQGKSEFNQSNSKCNWVVLCLGCLCHSQRLVPWSPPFNYITESNQVLNTEINGILHGSGNLSAHSSPHDRALKLVLSSIFVLMHIQTSFKQLFLYLPSLHSHYFQQQWNTCHHFKEHTTLPYSEYVQMILWSNSNQFLAPKKLHWLQENGRFFFLSSTQRIRTFTAEHS